MVDIEKQRAANLWEPFARKFPPVAKACRLAPEPEVDFDDIGGLAEPKDEIRTYACAVTSPEVYERWGTVPPSGLLLIGPPGCGKTLLAEALASETGTPFLSIDVSRLVLQLLQTGGQAGGLLAAWHEALAEMPQLTVYFDELDFMHSMTLGQPHRELPVAGIADFLLELIDGTIAANTTLTIGSTGRPDSLAPVFFAPGRFERVVGVQPVFPDDVIEALKLHAMGAEKRAGRTLFEDADWRPVVDQNPEAAIGDWVRLLHAVLRRKARCEAARETETGGKVTAQDLLDEVNRVKTVNKRLPSSTGRYL